MDASRNPHLAQELAAFGAAGADVCRTCGACSVECPRSPAATDSFRKTVRSLFSGRREDLRASPAPWLSCFCDECPAVCPLDRDPRQIMTAARRYLASEYDWTGLSRRLALSTAWQVGFSVAAAAAVLALLGLSGAFTPARMVRSEVSLGTFVPPGWVRLADLALLAAVGALLATNAFRMARWIAAGEKRLVIPALIYVMEVKALLVHSVKQLAGPGRLGWAGPAVLLALCAALVIGLELLLRAFGRGTIDLGFTSLFGYFAAGLLLYRAAGRRRVKEAATGRGHRVDRLFLAQLVVTGGSGILLGVFRVTALPYPAYIAYAVHLAAAVSMLLVQVPFGAWSHLVYRPLANYLIAVRARAKAFGLYAAPTA